MIPLTHGLILAAILFVLGLTGLVIRRNLLFMLIGLEIMAVAFGINGIHLGIMMVLNLMIGVISPPFGIVLFAVSKVAKIPMGSLIKALLPWFIALLVALSIIVIFPSISTILPSMMNLGG